jgi:uncharacterized protein (TIRG00374 family)
LKRNILKVFNFFLFLSIGILLLYLAFRNIEFQLLVDKLKHANYFWILLSLLISFAGFIVRALRWRLLIEPLGYAPGRSNTFYAVMIGYLANFAFPRIGEITRCGTLNRTEKIPLDSLIGTVIVERSIDVITMILLIILIFFSKIHFFGDFLTNQIFNPAIEGFSGYFTKPPIVWIGIIGGFCLIIIGLILFRKRLTRFSFIQKGIAIVKGVGNGLRTGFTMKRRGLFLLYTILLWTIYFLMTWVVVYALPATSHLKPIDGLFILVIGSIGITIPVQGGIGAFHWIVSLGLTLYDIPKEDGLAFATLSHESQALFIVLLGTFSLAMLAIRRKRKKENVEQS